MLFGKVNYYFVLAKFCYAVGGVFGGDKVIAEKLYKIEGDVTVINDTPVLNKDSGKINVLFCKEDM